MSESLPRAARRVVEALAAAGVEADVRVLGQSTRTAPEAAEAVGAPLGAIVKTLVFRGADSGRPLLSLISGENRASEERLAAELGEPVERPDGAWVREATGFAIGGIPPAGHEQAIPALVDEDLLAFDQVWCAAGTPNTLFPLTPDDLLRVTAGRVAPIAAEKRGQAP